MHHLHQILARRVADWRQTGYPCVEYPALAEILDFATDPETDRPRFLRVPQLRALETYCYLRFVLKTPKIEALYKDLIPSKVDLRKAFGLTHPSMLEIVEEVGLEGLLDRVRSDDDFVSKYDLEALRETLTLDYASYILALAMGAGKTMLIGAIIAVELALAIEYPKSEEFVRNALVFAPGTTIIRSLRELADTRYDLILPARLYKPFAASVKLIFTSDGSPTIPVIARSSYNVVVTNTEKIRIQKRPVRAKGQSQLKLTALEEQEAEIANARLLAIASLPNLAVFSDEAHHLFGQTMGQDLKRVRQTVNYLADNTRVLCVINTTGTPYFEKQPLKDVVVWYGLSQGIQDGILKPVADNIRTYDFDTSNARYFAAQIVKDFFSTYGSVSLPNGAPAKIAIYFPQNDDLDELRPFIEQALVEIGESPTLVLKNTSESSQAEIDAFNHLNHPRALHRVILLVNKGTEGWNCPSLFACALARKLKISNNFVLQAATRCLRQVPGNVHPARIYLSADNAKLLDDQLRETYGETLSEINKTVRDSQPIELLLRKISVPPLVVRQTRRIVEIDADPPLAMLSLQRPDAASAPVLTEARHTLDDHGGRAILHQTGETATLAYAPLLVDCYTAATELAAQYRLPLKDTLAQLRSCYPDGDVPEADLAALSAQIEPQIRKYRVREEQVEVALALVKPTGFERRQHDGSEEYFTKIVIAPDRVAMLRRASEFLGSGDFGFHYDPYNFDSGTEIDFFEKMLSAIGANPADVEDIYFTGALTDPAKTDFLIEYQDAKRKWRSYTPDFIVRLKSGKCLIVEIKMRSRENDEIDGRDGAKARAARRWQAATPDQIRYEMFFDVAGQVASSDLNKAIQFIKLN